MNKNIVALIVLVFNSLIVPAQTNLYVSPAGNDLNPGTFEQPFASLTAARDAIRKIKKDKPATDSYVVIIADGFYEMKEAFVLTQQDGGTQDYPVIYKAEKGARPVFSGGRKINGFIENKKALLPDSIIMDFNQVVENNMNKN